MMLAVEEEIRTGATGSEDMYYKYQMSALLYKYDTQPHST
jgi:hypothetical protein